MQIWGDLVNFVLGLKEGTCDPSWLYWGLVSPPSFWVFQDPGVGMWLTVHTGPLPLTGLMWHTFGSGCLPTTTNSSLYICLGFYCDLSGWSHNKTKFPSGISSDFDLIFPHSSACFVRCLLMPTCLQPILIHIVVEPMNLLRWTHLQLYWDNPNQLSQGVWALWPNISWYGWYPVVEWGMALYANTKAPRQASNWVFDLLAVSLTNFAMCS